MEVQKLEVLIENARVRQRVFLNVEDVWPEDSKKSFANVLSNYHSKKGRELCCSLIGLTPAKIKTASATQVLIMATNLSITATDPKVGVLKFIRKITE